jgi:hypothetical protein
VVERIRFENAYFIKLGREGEWEESSIKEGRVRIGWHEISLRTINKGDWDEITTRLRKSYGNKGVGTRDANALRTIAESTSEDLWVTFHASKLWWCRLRDGKVRDDSISKHRVVQGKWNDQDINGKKLYVYDIPGSISKTRSYRATICRMDPDELKRVINAEQSPAYCDLQQAKEALARRVESAITRLHWKDFEILVDLVFSRSNLRRTGKIGDVKDYTDIELEDPITGDRRLVQVKSQSSLKELREYAENFPSGQFERLYFVVHSPDKSLEKFDEAEFEELELILPARLATMVVDCGLVNWILGKVK